MHRALHPREDKDRLCVSSKEGGRGLASIKDCVNVAIQGLEKNAKKEQRIVLDARRFSILLLYIL